MTRRRSHAAALRSDPSPARSQSRISGIDGLLEAVPYLLGFHPYLSLVLIGLDGSRLVVTVRVDLHEVAESMDAGGSLLAGALGAMVRGGTEEVLAVLVEDAGPERPGLFVARDRLQEALVAQSELASCVLIDLIQVAAGRWRSLSCADQTCCPGDGRPLPAANSAFAAAAILDGVAPLACREVLEAQFEPLPEAELIGPALAAAERALNAATTDAARRRFGSELRTSLLAAARAADEQTWSPPTPEQCAAFATALTMISIRDDVWLVVDDGSVDGRPLWQFLARALPSPYDVAPLFLYGWAAWRAGDGAGASVAVARALAGDPGYGAAGLLAEVLGHGVDPRRFPRLREQATRLTDGRGLRARRRAAAPDAAARTGR